MKHIWYVSLAPPRAPPKLFLLHSIVFHVCFTSPRVFLSRGKKGDWSHVSTVRRLGRHWGIAPGQVVADHESGVAGGVVMVQLSRAFDIAPGTRDPPFQYLENFHVESSIHSLPFSNFHRCGMLTGFKNGHYR